jgi:hypothetical protein
MFRLHTVRTGGRRLGTTFAPKPGMGRPITLIVPCFAAAACLVCLGGCVSSGAEWSGPAPDTALTQGRSLRDVRPKLFYRPRYAERADGQYLPSGEPEGPSLVFETRRLQRLARATDAHALPWYAARNDVHRATVAGYERPTVYATRTVTYDRQHFQDGRSHHHFSRQRVTYEASTAVQ